MPSWVATNFLLFDYIMYSWHVLYIQHDVDIIVDHHYACPFFVRFTHMMAVVYNLITTRHANEFWWDLDSFGTTQSDGRPFLTVVTGTNSV